MSNEQLQLAFTARPEIEDKGEFPQLAEAVPTELFPPSLSETFGKVFDCIGIAEEEITAAMEATTDLELKERFNASFKHLLPTEPLSSVSTEVYRSHAREILDRVEKEEDVRPGTNAEVLAVLVEASQRSPLNQTGFLLYCRLFREVMPQANEIHHTSPYEGQDYHEQVANDLLDHSRRKLWSLRGAAI